MVFIVSAARSGSTLLRYLLDSHPEMTAPAELNLSAYLAHTVSMWARAEEARGERAEPEDGAPIRASDAACRKARKTLDAMTSAMVTGSDVAVFCDKSLTSVDHLDLLARCYPDASFVMLYRYPLDMIASGIEASKWGFNAYGFAPFLGAAPGDFVGGLANYWIDRTSRMVEFEREQRVAHARLYYELLCGDPVTTVRDLLDFIGVRHDARTVKSVIRKGLASGHATGPGDYKIDFTTSISRSSIGRGSLLPRTIGPNQTARIDQVLAELDYPSLDAAFGGDLGKLIGLQPDASGTDTTAGAVEALRDAVGQGLARARGRRGNDLSWLPLEIVVVGDRTQRLLALSTSGVRDVGSPDGQEAVTAVRLRCSPEALLDAIAGRNVAQLMHDGGIRADGGGLGAHGDRRAGRAAVLGLSGLLATAREG
jgi:hypothetical protein